MLNILILASEEGGHAANNWLYGDVKETLVSAIASIILFALLVWKAGPAIKKAMSDRTDRIAGEIDEAERARVECEQALDQVQASIANAEGERHRILSDARATAEQVKASLIERGQQEAAELKARAAADIEVAKAQITGDLQAEVARLALGAAEAVVGNSLDAGTQAELIENYIAQVGVNA